MSPINNYPPLATPSARIIGKYFPLLCELFVPILREKKKHLTIKANGKITSDFVSFSFSP